MKKLTLVYIRDIDDFENKLDDEFIENEKELLFQFVKDKGIKLDFTLKNVPALSYQDWKNAIQNMTLLFLIMADLLTIILVERL